MVKSLFAICLALVCSGCLTMSLTFDGKKGTSISLGADWSQAEDQLND